MFTYNTDEEDDDDFVTQPVKRLKQNEDKKAILPLKQQIRGNQRNNIKGQYKVLPGLETYEKSVKLEKMSPSTTVLKATDLTDAQQIPLDAQFCNRLEPTVGLPDNSFSLSPTPFNSNRQTSSKIHKKKGVEKDDKHQKKITSFFGSTISKYNGTDTNVEPMKEQLNSTINVGHCQPNSGTAGPSTNIPNCVKLNVETPKQNLALFSIFTNKTSPTEPPPQNLTSKETMKGPTSFKPFFRSKASFKVEDKVPVVRKCPYYKKLPDVPIAVDAFSYGSIPGVSAYFLSHFHSDHYNGLTSKFTNELYCSRVTANLVQSILKVKCQYINVLPLGEPVLVCNIEVLLLEANHCPGSVMFLFKYQDGRVFLHTGDFRFSSEMEHNCWALTSSKIHRIYLDTTYCDPTYTFPTQEEVVSYAISRAMDFLQEHPKALIVCGTYTIGKEKVFLGIAQSLGLKVWAPTHKFRILDQLEDENIRNVLVSDPTKAKIHVLSMNFITKKGLQDHQSKFCTNFTHILGFKPTGWEYNQATPLNLIRPRAFGCIVIYGLPYSEHSSYEELERFVKFIRPEKVISTVYSRNFEANKRVDNICKNWLANLESK